MHEIERKYRLLEPAVEIERRSAADGTLRSRCLIQQRYLDPRGWRLRLKSTPDHPCGMRHVLTLRRNDVKLCFSIDDEAASRLERVSRERPAKEGDPAGTRRYRLDDPEAWTIRLRRSTGIAGQTVRCHLTMKRGMSLVRCIEIESPITAAEHDAAAVHCGAAIRKRRVKIQAAGRLWEMDSFLNPELADLEYAEVELPSEDAVVVLPRWIGEEITHLKEYKNVRLMRRLAA